MSILTYSQDTLVTVPHSWINKANEIFIERDYLLEVVYNDSLVIQNKERQIESLKASLDLADIQLLDLAQVVNYKDSINHVYQNHLRLEKQKTRKANLRSIGLGILAILALLI